MSWPEVHGAVTHFPVALFITAAAYEVGAAVLRRPKWRVVSFWLLVAGVAMAVPSLIAGWMTGEELFGGVAQPPAIFVRHRAAAFTASGTAVVLLLWRVFSHDSLTKAPRAWSIAVILVVATLIGYAGYLGGEMVFAGRGRAGPAQPPPSGRPALAAAQNVPPDLMPGRQVFERICARCHGVHGEGKIGPRLAGSFLDEGQIKNTVIHGVPPVMPAFGKQLSPAEIQAVAAYVHWLATQP